MEVKLLYRIEELVGVGAHEVLANVYSDTL